MNKKTLIILLILIAALAYPWWRLKNNSTVFAKSIFDKATALGSWSYGAVDFSLSGSVNISGVQFTPAGFTQGFSIGSVSMETNIWHLLLSSELKMIESLPPNLRIQARNVAFSGAGSDLKETLVEQDYWPLVVGYQGGFGCGEITDRSFTMEQWQQIMPSNPLLDVELNYQNTGNFGLNFSMGVNARNYWYVNWSGTLELTDNSGKFTLQDALVERLYYTYSDAGFNQKRNDLCQQNHQDSFAAYRLHSAERLQQQLRVFLGGEMPQDISNIYQRSLYPETEVTAIFNLKDKQFLQYIFTGEQSDFLNSVDMEVAIDENDYSPVELKKIDYLAMDPELLKDQYEQKKKREEERLAELNKPKELIKTVKTTIGKQNHTSYVSVRDWGDAVGSKVMVTTKRGRPIFGRLKQVKGNEIVMISQYVTGTAEISVQRENILSLNLVR